jgi:hypothetical protein
MSTAVLRCYSLGSPYGKTPCESLAKGEKGEHIAEGFAEFKSDPIAVWGQLRGAKELLAKSKSFYRMDHAYVGRNDYYRITKGDFQPSEIVERPSDRWDALRKRYSLKVSDWRKGGKIVVTLSDPRTYDFFGVKNWPAEIEAQIKKHTNRPVVMRKRTESRPLAEDLRDAWCLVTYASNSVIEALQSGVPVFSLGPSIARPMGSSDLSKLEDPLYPENREEFFRHMAYCQFTPQELEAGALRRI